MKKMLLTLIFFSLFLNTIPIHADVFDGMMEIDNSLLFETNALDMSQMGSSFDMTFDATLPDVSPILLPETMDDLLLNNNNDLNPTVEINSTFDDMTLDLNETVNDLNDITDFNMDSLDNMFEANTDNIEILEGEIITPETDASGDFDPTNDSPTTDSENKDPDGDGEPGDDGPEDEGGDEEAFLFDFLYSNVVYADDLENKKIYYLRTQDTSYVLNSYDNYINYFISLIANKDITVQLTVEKNSAISVDVSYLYAIDEIPETIWEEYSDFCSEELKKELPYGVFYTNNNVYYFTESETDVVVKVKTDEPELEILIPLIANKGIQVAINHSNIDKETIYINDVILLEDLPNDIAEEYKKQYIEYEKTILYNFTGYLKTVDGYYCIVTDYGTFKLSSDIENVFAFIVSNANKDMIVKVHGYLDSETITINVIQIDY